MGGHYAYAPSARRKNGHLVQEYKTQRRCIGHWGESMHQLVHASSPAVENTASKRALSSAFSLRCSVHAGTSSNASCIASATAHAYACTSESIFRAVSARAQRSGRKQRARTYGGGVYIAQGQIPAPVVPSMAPTVCIVLSFVYEAKAIMIEFP